MHLTKLRIEDTSNAIAQVPGIGDFAPAEGVAAAATGTDNGGLQYGMQLQQETVEFGALTAPENGETQTCAVWRFRAFCGEYRRV